MYICICMIVYDRIVLDNASLRLLSLCVYRMDDSHHEALIHMFVTVGFLPI